MRSFRLGVRPAFYPVVGSIAAGAVLIAIFAPRSASASAVRPAQSTAASTSTTAPHTLVRQATSPAAAPTPTSAPNTRTAALGTPARSQPPTPRPSTPPPPVLAGQEAWLTIPSIGLSLPVFFGGQSTIDRGVATHYDGSGWRPAVAAGQPGTYWLAGHHVTHGAPFRNLPSIRLGDIVTISAVAGDRVVRYTITSIEVVPPVVSFATVYGPDTTTPRLLLQTCEATRRLLVHGVATAPAE